MNFNEWGFCIVTHEVALGVMWIGYENLSHSSFKILLRDEENIPHSPHCSHAYFRQLLSSLTMQRQEFTSQLPTQNFRTLETDLYKMQQCFTCQRQSIYLSLKLSVQHKQHLVTHRQGTRCIVPWSIG